MCDGRYKMIFYHMPSPRMQLFDPENAPWEMSDLNDRSDVAPVCVTMWSGRQYQQMWNKEDCETAGGFWQ